MLRLTTRLLPLLMLALAATACTDDEAIRQAAEAKARAFAAGEQAGCADRKKDHFLHGQIPAAARARARCSSRLRDLSAKASAVCAAASALRARSNASTRSWSFIIDALSSWMRA